MYRKYVNGEISALQSYIIIISIMIGTGVLNLSRLVAEEAYQDGWISVLINGILISLIVASIIYTASKFPQLNFLQYTSKLLSKPIGYIITLTFAIYSILSTATINRYLMEMINTWLLPNTPMSIISLIISITGLYLIMHGITVVARFNEVIVFLLIPLVLLAFVGLPYTKLVNLRPVGGSGIKNILLGIPPSFYAFGGYELIFVFYPYISNKSKPIIKYSVISVLLVTLFYIISVVSQIALYGAEEIQRVLYPSINYLRAFDFPVIERMELFFTIFWIFTVIGTLGLQFFASCNLLQLVFPTKTNRFYAYILTPIIFILSLVPKNSAEVVEYSSIVGEANIFFGIILPILLIIVFFIRKGGLTSEAD